MKKFPEAIMANGIEEGEEILFCLERRTVKGKDFTPMRAGRGTVTQIDKSVVGGKKLPVYVQLISRYIFAGHCMEMMA